jgi:hypothetical protein
MKGFSRITHDDIIDVIMNRSGLPVSRWYFKVEDDSILEHTKAPACLVSIILRFYPVKVLDLRPCLSMENYSFHPLLLQWQEMSGCNHKNYVRFGK